MGFFNLIKEKLVNKRTIILRTIIIWSVFDEKN